MLTHLLILICNMSIKRLVNILRRVIRSNPFSPHVTLNLNLNFVLMTLHNIYTLGGWVVNICSNVIVFFPWQTAMNSSSVNLCEDVKTCVRMVTQVLPTSHCFLLLFVGGLSPYWVTLPRKKNVRLRTRKSYGPLPENPLACGPPPCGLPP